MLLGLIHIAQAAETAPSGSVTELLGLDWKLFLAQLVNFGIVLFVLTKFVFRPLAKTLQDRSTRINDSLNTAKAIEEEKLSLTHKVEKELNRAKTQAAVIVSKAKDEAQQLKTEMLLQTKLEQDRLTHSNREKLQRESEEAIKEARGQLAELVTLATEKVLHEKIDKSRDEKLIKEMLKQLD